MLDLPFQDFFQKGHRKSPCSPQREETAEAAGGSMQSAANRAAREVPREVAERKASAATCYVLALAPAPPLLYDARSKGLVAEWLRRGLQILVRGFDSLRGLQKIDPTRDQNFAP